MTYSRSDVFCDWLTVTCHPSESFIDRLVLFLFHHMCPILSSDKGQGTPGAPSKATYRVGDGTLQLTASKAFHSASASGGALSWLRRHEIYRDYLNVLGEVPHNVSRLDATVDLFTDCPPVLRSLESRYPDDYFNFGRKALRVTRLYSSRTSDGQLTGTWYVGHRSNARVSARVYDKQAEALEKRGESLPPTTRIELTFRKDFNCSLYDALMPETIFYAHASPKLVDLPSDRVVLPWVNEGCVPWQSERKDYALTLDVFERRLAASPDLQYLAELSAQLGPGAKATVLRYFEAAFNRYASPSENNRFDSCNQDSTEGSSSQSPSPAV
ncbi:hypothetical protein [Shewanella sp. YQ_9]